MEYFEHPLSNKHLVGFSDVYNLEKSGSFLRDGFRFLDRILCFEIPVNSKMDNCLETLKDDSITIVCDNTIDDRLVSLAKKSFAFDRRFHLEQSFKKDNSEYLIDLFLNQSRKPQIIVYKAYHGHDLLGFSIVDEAADPNSGFFQNILSATKEGIKGRLVAVPLYRAMIKGEKEKFKKYYGEVSSSNIASINLHFSLGGKVVNVYDEFIKTKE